MAARGVGVVGVLVLIGALLYLRPLGASTVAVDAMSGSGGVTVRDSATRIELQPTGTRHRTGVVFYPGALVDPRAYVPNLAVIAAAGYPVVILKLPFNIAFFDIEGARAVIDATPRTTRWVVAGHSLGGVVASSVAGGTDRRIRGLLLWASYPNGSIAGSEALRVMSVSASQDALATPEKIRNSKPDLPPGSEFVEVEGAVHAFFGDYGEQSGDGTPTISRSAAQEQIRAASLGLVEEVDQST